MYSYSQSAQRRGFEFMREKLDKLKEKYPTDLVWRKNSVEALSCMAGVYMAERDRFKKTLSGKERQRIWQQILCPMLQELENCGFCLQISAYGCRYQKTRHVKAAPQKESQIDECLLPGLLLCSTVVVKELVSLIPEKREDAVHRPDMKTGREYKEGRPEGHDQEKIKTGICLWKGGNLFGF
ncbi:MAG: hypothetical protein IKN57_03015 [Parasporobacterium sp.]|nr:hypothetical protein [Parasporobacterium sp.]